MTGALIILAVTVVTGILLYVYDRYRYGKNIKGNSEEESDISEDGVAPAEETPAEETADDSGCCGMHLVCEKTSLSPMSADIIYYDDEELDRFIGRKASEYSPEEIEEFNEVLFTLLPQDVAGWSRSLQLRGIEPPQIVRDELIMIVDEMRRTAAERSQKNSSVTKEV